MQRNWRNIMLNQIYIGKNEVVFQVFGRSVRTSGIFIQERFYVIKIEPVIAPLADAIGLERPELTPESNRIRMDMQYMGDLVYGQHLSG